MPRDEAPGLRAVDISASPRFQRDVEALWECGPAEVAKVLGELFERLTSAERLEAEALLRKMAGRPHA